MGTRCLFLIIVLAFTWPGAADSGRWRNGRYDIGATPADIKANIEFWSKTKDKSYTPYTDFKRVDRVVHSRSDLNSHIISVRVRVENIPDESSYKFSFKWIDPDGRLFGWSEHVRPDTRSPLRLRGHWTMYPITEEFEFSGEPSGKYTLLVECPEGEVVGERSFNFEVKRIRFIDRVLSHSKLFTSLVIGFLAVGMAVIVARVLR